MLICFDCDVFQMSMEYRRRTGGSSNSGNVIHWSSSFLRQPARVLIVEALPPYWSETSNVICSALDNFLSLACSLDGPPRIPLLSLFVVSRQQECLLPFVVKKKIKKDRIWFFFKVWYLILPPTPCVFLFHQLLSPFFSVQLQQLHGNLARLRSCVAELRSIPGDSCIRGAARAGELLQQAVLDSLQQFKQYIRHSSTTNHTRNNNMYLEVGKDLLSEQQVKYFYFKSHGEICLFDSHSTPWTNLGERY